ncbi:hypothetical protein SLS56_011466 [Neofusicoccum ribis]|uniref:EthD domain-containing protein n=1 Tax=Neofusicoccum ribis TaxID=45134 RepID=A0ABR3SBJ6_9PEZI
MAVPERILRLSGSYCRKDGVSEEDFHRFMSTDHAVKCAKIHEKYGILKYQLAPLANSLKLPWPTDEHDVIIEYYFKDVSSLLNISADEDFKALHVECEPFIRMDTTIITLTWIEVYLEDGKIVNIDSEGKSLQPSFAEQSRIELATKAADKYY